ncbi:protein kinase [Candidatus Woesearchaeota archaeon]|nr:protein kinase [Candidatus Woesearchaeota archaeon]
MIPQSILEDLVKNLDRLVQSGYAEFTDADLPKKMQRIEEFNEKRPLGVGEGSSYVHRVKFQDIAIPLVVKMGSEALPSQAVIAAIKNEYKILKALQQPRGASEVKVVDSGIVHCFGFAVHDNRAFLFLEAAEKSLEQQLREERPMEPIHAIPAVIHLLDALAYARDKNVFHRDIKPSNLLLFADNSLKLSDWEIAKYVEPLKSRITHTQLLGSLYYRAPWVYEEGKEKLTPAELLSGELYSVAAVLFAMVTAEHPFTDTTIGNEDAILYSEEVIKDNKKQKDIRASVRSKVQHKGVQQIIERGLAPDATSCYQSIEEMRQELQEALEQGHVSRYAEVRELDGLLRGKFAPDGKKEFCPPGQRTAEDITAIRTLLDAIAQKTKRSREDQRPQVNPEDYKERLEKVRFLGTIDGRWVGEVVRENQTYARQHGKPRDTPKDLNDLAGIAHAWGELYKEHFPS